MIKRYFSILFLLVCFTGGSAQTTPAKPKIVIGITVDQMRWDFLYRYQERFKENGGIKRLLGQGFSNENTFIPYAPSVTACGHASLYTGTVPAIHGITGNAWWDSKLNRSVYCTEDDSVQAVGSAPHMAGQQSPRNMLASTICDELRLATNFRSKTIGIAIKDRGSILPAGHTASGAYWYNSKDGNFITSTYYMRELPAWVKQFNEKKWVNQLYQQDWQLLYPQETYVQSEVQSKTFFYDLMKYANTNYSPIAATPHGNALIIEMAKAAIAGEQLGADAITDFLALSFSSPDYIGHTFGPNSIEIEDMYLRFDIQLGEFLDYLDNQFGKGQYLIFLSADHGVSAIPEYLSLNKLPGGRFFGSQVMKGLNEMLQKKYKQENLVVSMYNYQVHFDHGKLNGSKINKKELMHDVANHLQKMPEVSHAFVISEMGDVPLPSSIKEMLANGYHPTRNGDVQVILKPGYIDAYGTTGTTHGSTSPYDTHIPLIWYGWKIKPGKSYREVYMTDVAPTLAALLQIQMPNGATGKVIEEVLR